MVNLSQIFINDDFAILKNGKVQKRGRVNLIGRLQLSTEKAREEENEGIVQLRIFRVQGWMGSSVEFGGYEFGFKLDLLKFGHTRADSDRPEQAYFTRIF